MTLILSFDVGGANTKAAALTVDKGAARRLSTEIRYFPVWKNPLGKLPEILVSLASKVLPRAEARPSTVALTMTAELSDVYRSKLEGVEHICKAVAQAFPDVEIRVLDVEGRLLPVEEAVSKPYLVAASNWYASGWFTSQFFETAILVDVGSTTTSIIPIVDGRVFAEGYNDMEKLSVDELVYTGSLRTSLAAVASKIWFKGRWVRVSSEYFAQTGDIHLILGHISREDYICDTPDGRGATFEEAAARIARTVCADLEMLTVDDVKAIARQFYEAQVESIASALRRKAEGLRRRFGLSSIPCIATGLGEDFLAGEAGRLAGLKPVVRLSSLTRRDVALMTPAVGLSFLAASKLEGRRIPWNPAL